MKYSYISHLHCPKCSNTYDSSLIQQLCVCGSPLLVDYDWKQLKKDLRREDILHRKPDLWRFHEMLPVEDEANVVSMGEGMTPLVPMPAIAKDMGVEHLWMKDEGMIPTGTFKARGAAVGVSKAKELGVKELAMPTNGNAGAAWALYAARAGIQSTIVMPVDAPKITRNEVAAAGANLYLVNGLISDAGKMVAQAVKQFGFYDVSTLKEPYRIEGKKTMGLEIAEQMGWEMPDVILYPTGGGVGLIGIFKALTELKEIGWIEGDLPRLVAVQATGCAPIVQAWKEGKPESEFWPNSSTEAFGINVPKALGDFLVLDAIYKTSGCAIAVTDPEMLKEQREVARLEGAFICPEGAAVFSAIRKLKETGWLEAGDKIVALNTGAGIKYPETMQVDSDVLEIGEKLPERTS
ncbi:MAG TPA: threonine synthase [Planococcus sp. (in: firmicutes)]|nr:threonine synthase [Planococcus sp. (in: firmicutes)]